ncbi:MAG: HD domain-containing protein [Patescibacteria group bacterium]
MNLQNLFKCVKLTHGLQQVKRSIFTAGEDRRENDSEHQYQLAMTAWYVIVTENLPLNVDKVLKYSLVHDMVEVYAGDAHFYGDRNGKEERERDAANRLRAEFSEIPEWHQLIDDYEHKVDKECLFIYALDKLLPAINIYFDRGRTWREQRISLDMVVNKKREKIACSEEVMDYFNQLVVLLKAEAPDLFSKTTDGAPCTNPCCRDK